MVKNVTDEDSSQTAQGRARFKELFIGPKSWYEMPRCTGCIRSKMPCIVSRAENVRTEGP